MEKSEQNTKEKNSPVGNESSAKDSKKEEIEMNTNVQKMKNEVGIDQITVDCVGSNNQQTAETGKHFCLNY